MAKGRVVAHGHPALAATALIDAKETCLVDTHSEEVKVAYRDLCRAHSPWEQTSGLLTFGALLFVCGAAPWMLPTVFLLFAGVCLPWRAVSFASQKYQFFLVDFCYVSIRTLLF